MEKKEHKTKQRELLANMIQKIKSENYNENDLEINLNLNSDKKNMKRNKKQKERKNKNNNKKVNLKINDNLSKEIQDLSPPKNIDYEKSKYIITNGNFLFEINLLTNMKIL